MFQVSPGFIFNPDLHFANYRNFSREEAFYRFLEFSHDFQFLFSRNFVFLT